MELFDEIESVKHGIKKVFVEKQELSNGWVLKTKPYSTVSSGLVAPPNSPKRFIKPANCFYMSEVPASQHHYSVSNVFV